MFKMKYKVGEKVKVDGKDYEVIADKNTSYNSPIGDPRLQNLKPVSGQDYLLKMIKPGAKVEPFKSVFENEIDPE